MIDGIFFKLFWALDKLFFLNPSLLSEALKELLKSFCRKGYEASSKSYIISRIMTSSLRGQPLRQEPSESPRRERGVPGVPPERKKNNY